MKMDDDGTLVFLFGMKNGRYPVVNIHIRGKVRMECLRSDCDTVTEFKSEESNQPGKNSCSEKL